MLKRRRSLRAAACAPLIAAFAAGAVWAQDNTVVGPPQLKDFQLPGRRTTPPAATPPAPQPQPATPARAAPPAATPAPRRESRPAERVPPRAAPRPAPYSAPTQAPVAQQPQPAAPLPTQIQAPPPATPPAAAPSETAPSEPGFNWLWLLLLIPVLGLAGFAWLRFGRRREARDEEDSASLAGTLGAARWVEDEAPEPEPVQAEAPPAPAAEPARAWLEIDIAPDRAAATDTQAVLHYELTLRNAGQLAARNIRIDSRLFNASADADIADFLAGPIHDQSGSPQIAIPPGEELRLGSAAGMAKEEVQAIQVQGRTIFVPSLATKVAYDWDGGTASGRTARAWLVGRETAQSAKMGPFRLDLGPRIYRQVGRRETKAAMA